MTSRKYRRLQSPVFLTDTIFVIFDKKFPIQHEGRAHRLNGKRVRKTPLRASNRKEALVGRPVYPDDKVAYDNILGVQENLDNLNIVLGTIEEVENLIDGTNIEIERDQDFRDS